MCLLASCSRSPQHQNVGEPPRQDNTENLKQADELFKDREDIEKIKQARDLVAKVRKPDHHDYEVEWKFAKYSLFLGDKLTGDEEKQKAFEEGRDAGRIASRIKPDQPEGYFWYGANLAKLAQLSPVTVGYTAVDDIKEAMNNVIQIQPGYQGASAYDILAQVELNTRLFGGKASTAADLLEKAIAIESNNSNLRLHLAQAYLDEDKTKEAKEQLQYILKMQPDPDYIPEHKENVAEAKRLLATRF